MGPKSGFRAGRGRFPLRENLKVSHSPSHLLSCFSFSRRRSSIIRKSPRAQRAENNGPPPVQWISRGTGNFSEMVTAPGFQWMLGAIDQPGSARSISRAVSRTVTPVSHGLWAAGLTWFVGSSGPHMVIGPGLTWFKPCEIAKWDVHQHFSLGTFGRRILCI